MTDNCHQATSIQGKYKFYQNGRVVGESSNLITDEGKRHILRFLAGQVRPLAGSIVVGAGQKVAEISDSRLTYEFDRTTIYLISPSYIEKKIIFKGTLGQGTTGIIHEVGLFSTEYGTAAGGSPSRTLVSFERSIETWSAPNFASGNQRTGTEALRLAPAASGTLTSVLANTRQDISGYSNSDVITLAFYNLNLNTSSVRIRFRGLDPAAYYESVVSTVAVGYNVATFTKASMTKVGVLDFSNIDSIEVAASAKATGPAQVDFDGVRIESTMTDVDNLLISRSVLATPVVKSSIAEMDVEYTLEVTL